MRTSCDECCGHLATLCGDSLAARLADGDGRGERAAVVDLSTKRAIRLLIEAGLVAPAARRRAG